MAKTRKIYDVLIIGAGAAGLFLAANLRGKNVAILEKNATPGKKILASGGGRCNITNRRISASNYLGDEVFVSNILKNLSYKDVLKFFGELKFNEQKQSQFFCESGSRAVLNALLKKVAQNGARISCGISVASARKISLDENGEILSQNAYAQTKETLAEKASNDPDLADTLKSNLAAESLPRQTADLKNEANLRDENLNPASINTEKSRALIDKNARMRRKILNEPSSDVARLRTKNRNEKNAINLAQFSENLERNDETAKNRAKFSEIFEVVCENGDKFYAQNLVVASGGLSYKGLGASDIGYKIARDFGIAVTPPTPALTGFTAQKNEFWFKNLSGVCFPAQISIDRALKNDKKSGYTQASITREKGDFEIGDKKTAKFFDGLQADDANLTAKATLNLFQKSDDILTQTKNASEKENFCKNDAAFFAQQKLEFGAINDRKKGDKIVANSRPNAQRKIAGDILFTHKGISGPAILNASLFWQKGLIEINFCPGFDLKIAQNSKKRLSAILPLPRRFTLEFLRASELCDKPFCDYDAIEREKISRLFCYKFAPAGTFGFERAEVTRGGVDTDAIESNCGSKYVCGLYFIGEVLDVTGMLGGYNLHFAFSCAAGLAKTLNAKNAAATIKNS